MSPLEAIPADACDPGVLAGRRIAVFGYGAQGRAQAANLKDAGLDVSVALRPGSPNIEAAEAAGLRVSSPDAAAGWADVAVILVPDLVQGALYREVLEPALRRGAALVFAHGYAVHYGEVQARDDLDVVMSAPLGIGEQVRRLFQAGGGVPGLVAVAQDASGEAWGLAKAYAAAQGHARAAVFASSFQEETETDLFAEQAVLVGGLTSLMRAGYETLVDAGYPEELAYLSCVNEVKLIADLVYQRGIAGMQDSISDVAAFGAARHGERVISDAGRSAMASLLSEIRDGAFHEALAADREAGGREVAAARRAARAHPMEKVGERLRRLMPWLSDGG